MSKSANYQDYLIESLNDPELAAEYLNAALEDGDVTVFLVALRNVVKAQGGVKKLAESSNKSRTSLYKALSTNGNPYLKSTNEILDSLGFHLVVSANKDDAARQ